jgi:TatD DNase family protein
VAPHPGPPVRWVDSHCHLEPGPGVDEVVAEAGAAGVVGLVNVGTDVASSAKAIEVASARHGVWATAGVHPHDAAGGIDGLADLLERPGVVAVGECGLDYHYDHSPRPVQREVFAAQVALAAEWGLPLVVHSREAWDDTLDILGAQARPEVVVLHCFTGGPTEARRCLDLGAYLSFSGIVSFKGAPEVRDAAALCPSDRYLVETDSPYLAPVPHRGRSNRPAWVPLVGEAVAAARGTAPEEVAGQSTANAVRALGLDLS